MMYVLYTDIQRVKKQDDIEEERVQVGSNR